MSDQQRTDDAPRAATTAARARPAPTAAPIEELFRRRLTALRAVRNLSLRDLEDLSGVSHNTIRQAERGLRNISLTNAAKITVALGWTLPVFLSDAPGGPLDELRAGRPPDEAAETTEHASVDS